MSERLAPNSERETPNSELTRETDTLNERLRENLERNAEKANEQNAESAKEAVEKALADKKENHVSSSSEKQEQKHSARPTKNARETAFKKEMATARSKMSAPSRNFSKLIHTKPVEKASEAVGSTIARPNALLAGSIAAFLVTSGVYFWAKYVGYPLSGFETIGAFIIGWLVGIIFDFSRIMITGKNT